MCALLPLQRNPNPKLKHNRRLLLKPLFSSCGCSLCRSCELSTGSCLCGSDQVIVVVPASCGLVFFVFQMVTLWLLKRIFHSTMMFCVNTSGFDYLHKYIQMSNAEWEGGLDDRLLQMIGDVRRGIDTSMGQIFNERLYKNIAARLSDNHHRPLTFHEWGERLRHFKQIASGGNMRRATHPLIPMLRFRRLLTNCFSKNGFKEVRIPKFKPAFSRSTGQSSSNFCTASCSHSVAQAEPAEVKSSIDSALVQLHLKDPNLFPSSMLAQAARFLKMESDLISTFLELPDDQSRINFIVGLNLPPVYWGQ